MEIIKKKIELVTTTTSTVCKDGVVGSCYINIPDMSINYNIKLMLTTKDIDFGFFDILPIHVYGYGYGYGGFYDISPIGLENLL